MSYAQGAARSFNRVPFTDLSSEIWMISGIIASNSAICEKYIKQRHKWTVVKSKAIFIDDQNTWLGRDLIPDPSVSESSTLSSRLHTEHMHRLKITFEMSRSVVEKYGGFDKETLQTRTFQRNAWRYRYHLLANALRNFEWLLLKGFRNRSNHGVVVAGERLNILIWTGCETIVKIYNFLFDIYNIYLFI